MINLQGKILRYCQLTAKCIRDGVFIRVSETLGSAPGFIYASLTIFIARVSPALLLFYVYIYGYFMGDFGRRKLPYL